MIDEKSAELEELSGILKKSARLQPSTAR